MLLLKELKLGEDATSVSAEYLFDTPLAPALAGISVVVDADNVVDHEQWKTWSQIKRRGKDNAEAKCDQLLDLLGEDEAEVDDDDFAMLEEQLREEMEIGELLDDDIAEARAKQDLLSGRVERHPSVSGTDALDDRLRSDLHHVGKTFEAISKTARIIEVSTSPAMFAASSGVPRYLAAEDEFRAALTRFSKSLLSTRSSLLSSAFKTPADPLGLSRRENEELKNQYRDASRHLIRAKMEHKFQETCSNFFKNPPGISHQALPTSCHLEMQELKKKLDKILDEAANCFTSCKDSSDLDLQLARLNYFVNVKRQIKDYLTDQYSRLSFLSDLLVTDRCFREDLDKFLKESLASLASTASENASKQQSLNVVSSFVNAPSPHSGSSPYSDALLAFISLVIPDVPPLLPSSKAVSDEEVMELLCAEWKRREAQCAVDAEAWEKDLYPFASGLLALRDRVAKEASEVPQYSVELRRLTDQYKMATKTVTRAVDLHARASKPAGPLAQIVAKAPVYFHLRPDKFRLLVEKMNSLKTS